jgi:hypothetical protein
MNTLPQAADDPRPVDREVLAVYRMMPTSDIARLLEHIDWLERELEAAQNFHAVTARKLESLTRLVNRHRRDVHATLDRFLPEAKPEPGM